MHHGNEPDDPTATARLALASEDREYWLAHPELQGIVAHFTAKVLQHRPNDVRAFARETFSDCNLKDQVEQAIARNGGWFGHEQQLQEAAGASARRRARQDDGKKRKTRKEISATDEATRGKSPGGGRASSSVNTTARAKTR